MSTRDAPAGTLMLALMGDVMLGRLVDRVLTRQGPAYPWGDTLPVLRPAHLRLLNLECVIAEGGRPWSRWHKVFHFRAGPAAISTLKLAGIDCVALANNHVLDYEEDAFLEMLDLLEQNGIAYVGAGRNSDEAARPAILERQGVRVGVVAFTDNEPGWAAGPATPGTNYIPISLEERSLGPVREAVGRARAEGADPVVFSIHWGPNMVQRPPPLFREFAHAVIDTGADLFFGHSAHVFQGIEFFRDRPIIYDAGDFVDDYAVDASLRNDLGLLFTLEIEGRSVSRIEMLPTLIKDCQVNLAAGHDFEEIAHRITVLSAEMGTAVHRQPGRLSAAAGSW